VSEGWNCDGQGGLPESQKNSSGLRSRSRLGIIRTMKTQLQAVSSGWRLSRLKSDFLSLSYAFNQSSGAAAKQEQI